MNIVFAVQKDQGWDSLVSSRFGRAEGFLCYNEEEDSFSYASNADNATAGHGAGIQASQAVAGMNAEVAITGGDYGPKAADTLKSAGIKMIANTGELSVKEVYDKFKNQSYKYL